MVPEDLSSLFGTFAGKELAASAVGSMPWVPWREYLHRLEGDLGLVGTREGVATHVHVGPGIFRVSRRDYARRDRAIQREYDALPDLHDPTAEAEGRVCRCSACQPRSVGPTCYDCEHSTCRALRGDPPRRRGRVTAWSMKSRANMVRTLASLDYAPLLEHGAPAMVTLTYPGDWLTVAPSAAVCSEHLRRLSLRYKRAWGRPLVGTWKREFQRRGAPHFHILTVPPADRYVDPERPLVEHSRPKGVDGEAFIGPLRRNRYRRMIGPLLPPVRESFASWLSRTWAEIVGHPDPLERANHLAAGTNVDYREGSRFTDPVRVGVYFSKHGSFSAKEYQNEAPAEWLEDEEAGVGRFWGVWGLERAVAVKEVGQADAERLLRTARRWHRAQGATVKRQVWRKETRETVDTTTGEIVTTWKWRKRSSTRRLRRLGGRSGFLLVNDGPGFALALSRQFDPPRAGGFSRWERSLA